MGKLNLDRIRGRQKEMEQKGGNYFKPTNGRNVIRVFTFEHKVTKEDVKAGLFEAAKLNKTVTEIDRLVTRFFVKGGKSKRPVLCLSDKDPLMLKWKKLRNSSKKADQEAAQDCRPQNSYFLNIVNMGARDKGIIEYAAPKTVYKEILANVLDPDFGEEILGAKGRDIVIEYDENKQGSEMYSVRLRPQEKSDELPDSLQETVRDFYDPAVYAELGTAPTEDGDDESDEEEEDEDDEPKKGKKKAASDDEDDEESDDEDEDDSDDSSDDDDEDDTDDSDEDDGDSEDDDEELEDSDEDDDESDEDEEDGDDDEDDDEDAAPSKAKAKKKVVVKKAAEKKAVVTKKAKKK